MFVFISVVKYKRQNTIFPGKAYNCWIYIKTKEISWTDEHDTKGTKSESIIWKQLANSKWKNFFSL